MRDYTYQEVVWWSPTLVNDVVLWTTLFGLVVFAIAMYFGGNE